MHCHVLRNHIITVGMKREGAAKAPGASKWAKGSMTRSEVSCSPTTEPNSPSSPPLEMGGCKMGFAGGKRYDSGGGPVCSVFKQLVLTSSRSCAFPGGHFADTNPHPSTQFIPPRKPCLFRVCIKFHPLIPSIGGRCKASVRFSGEGRVRGRSLAYNQTWADDEAIVGVGGGLHSRTYSGTLFFKREPTCCAHPQEETITAP